MVSQKFYLNQPEPNKSCLLALRSIILHYHPDFSETTKYGMPCFLFKGKILCYLWKDKHGNEPYILFADGNRMNHTALVQGSRARMKVLPIDPNRDIDLDLVKAVLKEAVELVGI